MLSEQLAAYQEEDQEDFEEQSPARRKQQATVLIEDLVKILQSYRELNPVALSEHEYLVWMATNREYIAWILNLTDAEFTKQEQSVFDFINELEDFIHDRYKRIQPNLTLLGPETDDRRR